MGDVAANIPITRSTNMCRQRYRYAKLPGTEMAIGRHSLWTNLFIIKIGVLYRNLRRKENSACYKCKKGKAVPLQAWSGPEGSRKLNLPDFMTTAQGCGKVVNLTHRPPLPPGNAPGTHFC